MTSLYGQSIQTCQAECLQQALTDCQKWCEYVGLTLSQEKTAALTVANAWGRRSLAVSPIVLQLNGTAIPIVGHLLVLGLEISVAGSAAQ